MFEILAIYLGIGLVDAILFLLFLRRAGEFPTQRKEQIYIGFLCLLMIVAHPYFAINELTRMYFNTASDSGIIDAEVVDDKKGKK
jgi:4-amino-4-deoxy-L-arabinose transferase-like glycosyltransferase